MNSGSEIITSVQFNSAFRWPKFKPGTELLRAVDNRAPNPRLKDNVYMTNFSLQVRGHWHWREKGWDSTSYTFHKIGYV